MKRIAFLIGAYLLALATSAQQSFEDSLLQQIPAANDTNQITIYNSLCWHFIYSETPKAIAYGKKAAEVAEQMDYDRGRASTYNHLGVGYDVLDIKDSALYFYGMALEAGKRINNQKSIAGTRNNIGLVYWHLGRYEDALKEYIASLKIFESLRDSLGIGNNLNNIGLIKHDLKAYDEALDFQKRALKIRQKINDSYGISASLGNLSTVLFDLGEVDSSLKLMTTSASLKRSLNDRYGLIADYRRLGVIYSEIEQLDSSLFYYHTSLDIARELGVQREMASLYLNIGTAYRNWSEFDLAKVYLDSSMAISNEQNDLRLLMMGHASLAVLKEKQGKPKKALFHQRQQQKLKDSLFGKEKQEQLEEIEIRYETEKKEARNRSLQKENEIARLENQKSQSLLYTSLGLFALFSLGGGLFYSRRASQRKSEHQQLLIGEKEKGLRAMVEATETERKRISGRLHDGIGQEISALKLSWEKLERSDQELAQAEKARLKELIGILGDTADELRIISHQMMPRALERLGLVAAISDMLEKSLEKSGIQYYFEQYYIKNRFNKEVELSAYRIIQELVNNIIRHSRATEVFVQLFKNKDTLLIIVEDNGIGIDPDRPKDGIGLTNIQARLNTVEGEFYIAPGPKQGTVAIVRIPV